MGTIEHNNGSCSLEYKQFIPPPSPSSQPPTKNRFETSLGQLTRRFIELLKESQDGVSDLRIWIRKPSSKPSSMHFSILHHTSIGMGSASLSLSFLHLEMEATIISVSNSRLSRISLSLNYSICSTFPFPQIN